MMPTLSRVVINPGLRSGEEALRSQIEISSRRDYYDQLSIGSHPERSGWGQDEWASKMGVACDHDDEDDHLLLDSSRRSTSTMLTSSLSPSTHTRTSTATESHLIQDSSQEGDDKKKKKKKSKKKKDKESSGTSGKKKKTKRKKKVVRDDDDDNQTTVTERDEKLVSELCSFLSNTLSTSTNTESFLRLLKEEAPVQQENQHPAHTVVPSQYATLQSPEPSVCGSYTSHVSTLSLMHSIMPHARGVWTAVDPPSLAQASHVSLTSPTYRPKPSITAPGQKILSSPPRSQPSESPISTSAGTTKRSNCESDVRVLRVSSASVHAPPLTSQDSFQDLSPATSSEMADPSEGSLPESSPEELFLALPQEFRSYLLGLHAEELQNAKAHTQAHPQAPTQESAWAEEFLFSSGQGKIPLETYHDHDAQSVASELTGLTGMVSHAVEPVVKGNIFYFGRDLSTDDSSNVSDDSDDESVASEPDVREPSLASFAISGHRRQPRRSSMASSVASHERQMASRRRQGVRFHTVQIREYDTVLDNNPAVTRGPAIALGWTVMTEYNLLVTEHDNGRHRRYGDSLMLSSDTREGILLKLGYNKADMESCVRRIQKAQNQRRRTAQQVHVQNLEFAMERVGKSFKNLLQRRSSKRNLA
jgi:hypothetical protein